MNYRDSFSESLLKSEPAAWPWLAHLRQEAYERFKALGFPTQKEEAWKYTSLGPLLEARLVSPGKESLKSFDPKRVENSVLAEEEHRLVFVNGIYSEVLSSPGILPHGVFFERLSTNIELTPDLVKPYLASRLKEEKNPFSLINAFSFKDGIFVTIPKNTVVENPLHILFVSTHENGRALAFYPRILVVLGEEARANLVVNSVGDTPEKYFSNTVSEIVLEKGARLSFSTVQRESKAGEVFLSNHYSLNKESHLDVLSFSQGGLLTRNEHHVEFKGENGFVSLKGLSVLSGDSQVFCHMVVDHEAPECTSRQFFKNILTDRSKSEFNSLVHVHRDAKKSDSNQLNKNLLLSDFAQSYSRPKLQIDNDDVTCTHGSATGQLQEAELFYLRSRGFSESQARFVLTYGFAEEILEEVKPASLKSELETLVSRELERVIKHPSS